MKRSSSLLYLIILTVTFTGCMPVLKEGEKINTGLGNAHKFWNADQTDFKKDTLVLSAKSAAIVSKFKLKNFTLIADLLTTDGAEGSLDFHTVSGADSAMTGYSVSINNTGYRNGSPGKTGGISRIRNNYVRTVPDNEWFALKIEVKSNRITVFVNDRIISDYLQPEEPVRIAGLENMKLSEGFVRLRKTTERGTISLGNIFVEADRNELPPFNDTLNHDAIGEMLDRLNQQNFPVIDFHGHLKGGLTVDQVSEHGRISGYNYGIAPNCGLNFPVTNDSSLNAWYDEMSSEPVFKAMQCEGREWITLFSPEVIAKF